MNKISFLFLIPVISLVSCSSSNSSVSQSDSQIPASDSGSSSIIEDPRPDLFISDNPGYQEDIPHLDSFNPTLFSKDSFVTNKSETLSEGVKLDTNSFNLNNGHKVIANTLYVDLNKATIKTNYSSAKAVVYQSILDFENKNEQDVIAGINADFFGTVSVNAYVKDNQIIKDAHNDKGIYDYTNLEADIPASMPMLFGVSNTHTRIGPIVKIKP